MRAASREKQTDRDRTCPPQAQRINQIGKHEANSNRNAQVQANCAFIADRRGKLCRVVRRGDVSTSDCSKQRGIVTGLRSDYVILA